MITFYLHNSTNHDLRAIVNGPFGESGYFVEARGYGRAVSALSGKKFLLTLAMNPITGAWEPAYAQVIDAQNNQVFELVPRKSSANAVTGVRASKQVVATAVDAQVSC